MTPKAKALELYDKYEELVRDHTRGVSIHSLIKESTLIAIDEIMPIVAGYEDALSASQQSDELEYWKEVKEEIHKL